MTIASNGNVTMPEQACMVFTNAIDVTDPSEDTPLQFSGLDVSKGGMAESNNRSRITVPTAGVYLIHAMVAGSVVTASSTDGVEIHLRKNGSRFPSESAFPISTYGSTAGDEYYFDFTIIVSLSANDYLEVALTNIDASQANIGRGVFCVTLLH